MLEAQIHTENNRVWTKVQETYNVTVWTTMWWCADGDGVSLYINKDESGFELSCFSGIPASSINIDSVDFGTMWDKARSYLVLKSINNYSFESQCVHIADYLCSLFCEWKNI
jgi:hypothetical protein